MKNLLYLFSFLLISSAAFASFPVKKSIESNSTELIVDNDNAYNDLLPPAGTDFMFGPFLIGFLFGLIGVGLVHIFSSDRDAKKNSWYGFGTWLIFLLVLVSGSGY